MNNESPSPGWRTYVKALRADWLWYSRAPLRWYWKMFIWYHIRFGTDDDRKRIRHARVWGMGDMKIVDLIKRRDCND